MYIAAWIYWLLHKLHLPSALLSLTKRSAHAKMNPKIPFRRSLMEAIQELLDKQAIHDKLCTYCRSMDRIDVSLGRTVFTEDSTVDYGPHYRGSGWGFVEWSSRTHAKTYQATSHQISNCLIRLGADGRTAASETYLHTLQLTKPGRDGKCYEVHVAGRYLDRWVCVDGDWKICSRQLVQDIAELRPCAVSMVRFGGRHDHEDPSYALFDTPPASSSK